MPNTKASSKVAAKTNTRRIANFTPHAPRVVRLLIFAIGDEYRLNDGKTNVDGFITSTNTVIEFHGDYFHGNPATTDPRQTRKGRAKILKTTMTGMDATGCDYPGKRCVRKMLMAVVGQRDFSTAEATPMTCSSEHMRLVHAFTDLQTLETIT